MRHLKTPLAVLGAVTILVLAGNTIALAATGHSFILGASNSANNATTLTRTTSGTALNIHTKSTSNAPFAVNGHGKVANLNADTVDGYDSSALRNQTYVVTHDITVATNSFSLPVAVPAGNYLVSYSASLSGAENGYVDCYIGRSGPPSSSYVGESEFNAGAQAPGITGAGYVSVSGSQTVYLHCSASTNFTTFSLEPVQLVATRVDTVRTSAPLVAAKGARSAH